MTTTTPSPITSLSEHVRTYILVLREVSQVAVEHETLSFSLRLQAALLKYLVRRTEILQ